MGGLVDPQLREDLLNVGSREQKISLFEDGNGLTVGEDGGSWGPDCLVKAAQLGFVPLEDLRVL